MVNSSRQREKIQGIESRVLDFRNKCPIHFPALQAFFSSLSLSKFEFRSKKTKNQEFVRSNIQRLDYVTSMSVMLES